MQLVKTSNQDEQFVTLTHQLDAELRQRYGQQQDFYAPHNRLDPIDTALLGVVDGQAVACGCFKRLDAQSAEVKRMFVHPEWRRRGAIVVAPASHQHGRHANQHARPQNAHPHAGHS